MSTNPRQESKATPAELIKLVAQNALPAAHQLVPEWLPDGTCKGAEWIAPNPTRDDRQAGSFGVSLATGRWNDFADPEAKGGDLVSLLAYLRGCSQLQAAKEIDHRLGFGFFNGSAPVHTPAPVPANDKRQAYDHEQQQRQEKAASTALRLWNKAKPANPDHPYLKSKHLPALHLRQLPDGRLLVPLGSNGKLVNLQSIDAEGNKRFLSGGQVKGCYSPIGVPVPNCRVYICEGWATGAAIHQVTGCPVMCAMTANNLEPVALFLRQQFGDLAELVIAGDDDRNTKGNPGRTAANRAAQRAGALVLFPEWPANAPDSLTDFNDLYVLQLEQERGTP